MEPSLTLSPATPVVVAQANSNAANSVDVLTPFVLAANQDVQMPRSIAALASLADRIKREDARTESRTNKAIEMLNRLAETASEKRVQASLPTPTLSLPPAPVPAAPVTTSLRSSAAATVLSETAKAHIETPPNESEHLIAFEAATRQFAEATRNFEAKWAPVKAFAASNPACTEDELNDVIAATGNPADYDSEQAEIKEMSLQSASHLNALGAHVVAYQKANGADNAVREVAERVEASLAELAPCSPEKVDEGKPETKQPEAGTPGATGPGAAGPGKNLAEKAYEALRALIQRFVEMFQRLLGFGAKPS